MKRIGLLSDTHGYWDEKYVHYFSTCDEIWHVGDIGSMELLEKLSKIKPVRAVYGNIDGSDVRLNCPRFLRFQIEGATVLMTHIGGKVGFYTAFVSQLLYAGRPNLFIYGHSHILHVEYDRRNRMLCINPGAAGKYGQQAKRTLVRFSIDKGAFSDLEVIELGQDHSAVAED